MADQPIQTSVAVAPVRPEGISARNWLERLLPYASVAVLFTALSIVSPYFLTVSNLSSVARQTAVINIIALGMTLIMISGGIDLSVGSVLAFSGICGTTLLEAHASLFTAVAGAVLAGAAWGLLNSLVITLLKVSPFIATLGTMGVARGITLVITGGETDVCVLATVLGAIDFGYRVVLVTDALCSSSDATHDALLTVYHQRFAQQVETVEMETVLSSWN